MNSLTVPLDQGIQVFRETSFRISSLGSALQRIVYLWTYFRQISFGKAPDSFAWVKDIADPLVQGHSLK